MTILRSRSVWNRLSLSISLLTALTLGYFVRDLVQDEQYLVLFGVFAIVPFGASSFMFVLGRESRRLIDHELLSATERKRVGATLSKKRGLYWVIGAINGLMGIASITVLLFIAFGDVVIFIGATSIFFAVITFALSYIEHDYYDDFRQMLKQRKENKAEKEKILNDMNGDNN